MDLQRDVALQGVERVAKTGSYGGISQCRSLQGVEIKVFFPLTHLYY